MGEDRKKHSAASGLLITLRKLLGMTQQEFAGQVMNTAVTTIGRWETSNPPPRGEALLKLADIAGEHNQPVLAEELTILYLDEIMPRLTRNGVAHINYEAASGYILRRIDGEQDIPAAVQYLRRWADELEGMGKGKSPC